MIELNFDQLNCGREQLMDFERQKEVGKKVNE
jgi:hypothetical protein